jgi:hypothetical protein
MINEVEVGTVVYETQDYSVRLEEIVDVETKLPLVVYGLINNSTGVREAELRALTTAISWATKVQADLNESRIAEEQAAAIVAAMPSEEREAVFEADFDVNAAPAITEADMKRLIDGE